MREFVKYIKFAFKISKGRILLLLLISIIAALLQTLAAAFILSAITYSSGLGDNFVAKIAISLIQFINITNNPSYVLGLLLFLTALSYAISGMVMILGEWYKASFLGNLYVCLQKGLISDLYMTDYQIFLKYNIGELSNINITQLHIVVQSLRMFITVISSSIFAIASSLLPFLINYKIVLVTLIIFTPIALLIRYINRKMQQLSRDNVLANSEMNEIILQILSNYKYLKSTKTYCRLNPKLKNIARKNANLMIKLAILGAFAPNVLTPLAIVVICVITYWQVTILNISIIDACAALGLMYHAAQQAISIPTQYQKFLATTGSIDIYSKFRENLIKNREFFYNKPDLLEPDFSGDIELNNLSFSYNSSEKIVLKNISIQIPNKSMVAFVGESGSGKSTLVNIITGLLKPSSGNISLSGILYDKLNIPQLRNYIAYVTQEPVVFNDTIINNISMWDENYSISKIENASIQASANSFINELQAKYNTLLGDNGVNISGGQRQRISIARELYKNAQILILDEATSALDSETEKIIQGNLKRLHGTKTIIIIAHRLSTIKDCDKIFVLDQGRIVEQGSFDELIALSGKFKEMVDRQSL